VTPEDFKHVAGAGLQKTASTFGHLGRKGVNVLLVVIFLFLGSFICREAKFVCVFGVRWHEGVDRWNTESNFHVKRYKVLFISIMV